MGLKTSNGTGGGNWSAGASWSGSAVPEDGDYVAIANGDTITIDDSAAATISLTGVSSAYNAIDIQAGGKLQYLSTATVDHTLVLTGNLNISGTLEIGTSANPIGSARKFTIKIQCASDGERGVIINTGGVMTLQGYNKGGWKTKLSADEAAGQTELSVASSTGFSANDEIVIAGTQRGTTMECEKRTVSSTGAGTITVSAGLTYAHAGAASPIQADIINLTRNIVVTANTTTAVTYLYATGTAAIDCDWVEFSYLGENAANKYGIYLLSTSGGNSFSYCSIHDCEDFGIMVYSNYVNVVIEHLAAYNLNTTNSGSSGIYIGSTSGTGNSIDDVILIGGGSTSTSTTGINLEEPDMTIGSLTVANWGSTGSTGAGIKVNLGSGYGITATALTVYSCGRNGINFGQNSFTNIGTLTTFRNNSTSMFFSATVFFPTIGTYNSIGDTEGIYLSDQTYNVVGMVINAGQIKEDTGFASTYGLRTNASSNAEITFNGVNFGAHSTNNIYVKSGSTVRLILRDCELGATNEFSDLTILNAESYIKLEDYDGTTGAMKSYFKYGYIERDATTYYGASGASGKLVPNSATSYCLSSGTRKVAVASGQTCTPHVYVRENAAYNGSRARLYVRKCTRMGITSDTVLDTATAASDEAWEELTGTTAAVSADGVLEFYVACDGTAGQLNVDEWSVT